MRPHPIHTTSPHAALLNSAGRPTSRPARSQSRLPRHAITAPTLSHPLNHIPMVILPLLAFTLVTTGVVARGDPRAVVALPKEARGNSGPAGRVERERGVVRHQRLGLRR